MSEQKQEKEPEKNIDQQIQQHSSENQVQTNVQTFEVGKDYIVPSWTSKPTKKYYFEIIKNGALLENLELIEKDFLLIGKHGELSDIIMEHPSISRKHAILQHKNSGELFIYDLGSTHGTQVNNRKLPGHVYHKLNPFDSIKFGQSTRTYILRCEEIEKEQEQLLEVAENDQNNQNKNGQEQQEKKTMRQIYLDMLENDPYFKQLHKATSFSGGVEQKKLKGKADNEDVDDNGISWGMVDEQEIYDYQDPDELALEPDLLRRLPGLNDKQLDKIQKYEEKLNKYRLIEGELDDIISKERKEFGLDEKIKVRKEKLQSKVQEALSMLEQAEDNVKLVVLGEQKEKEEETKNKRKQIQMNFDNDQDSFEEDEFYDRTRDLVKKKVKTEQQEKSKGDCKMEMNTELYWSLKKKLENLVKERHQCNVNLVNNTSNQTVLQSGKEEDDELEKYMSNTSNQLKVEERNMIVNRLQVLNKEIDEVSETLKYVKPEIQSNIDQFEKQLQDRNIKIDQDKKDERETLVDQQQKKQKNNWKDDDIDEDLSDDEKQQQFTVPANKISQTMQSLKSISNQRRYDDNEQLTDEQILQLSRKELDRQKRYNKAQKDQTELYDELMEDYQKDIQLINEKNLASSQKVFDITKNKQVKGKIFKH